MNEKALKLVWLMVLSTMAKKNERTWALYEDYIRETRLHVPIKEYIGWREERRSCESMEKKKDKKHGGM